MRIRICYRKNEAGRYLAHLDLARTWERTLRRAEVPLAFSEGFNPHPKMSFASALALGIIANHEFLDVDLREERKIEELTNNIVNACPKAISVVAIQEVPDHGIMSLSAQINVAIYTFEADITDLGIEKVTEGITKLLESTEVWREPKVKPGKKTIPAKQVRHLIRNVAFDEIEGKPNRIRVKTDLVLNNEAQLRPQEIWQFIAKLSNWENVPECENVTREALLIANGKRLFYPMKGIN